LRSDNDPDKSRSRYQAQRSDLGAIPSPFWGNTARLGRHGSTVSDVLKFDPLRSWRHGHGSSEDRRLPISELMRGDGSLVEDVQAVPARIIGWEHLQHLGEHLVSPRTSFSNDVLSRSTDIQNLANSFRRPV